MRILLEICCFLRFWHGICYGALLFWSDCLVLGFVCCVVLSSLCVCLGYKGLTLMTKIRRGSLARHGHVGPTPKTLENRKKAVEFRMAGYTYEQIGTVLGVTKQMAYKHVKNAMEDTRRETRENVKHLQMMTHIRCERMINKNWLLANPTGKMKNPDDLDGPEIPIPVDGAAVDRVMRLMALDAKIMGYESASKHQLDVSLISTSIQVVVDAILTVLPEDSAGAVLDAVERGMTDVQGLITRSAGGAGAALNMGEEIFRANGDEVEVEGNDLVMGGHGEVDEVDEVVTGGGIRRVENSASGGE